MTSEESRRLEHQWRSVCQLLCSRTDHPTSCRVLHQETEIIIIIIIITNIVIVVVVVMYYFTSLRTLH